MTAQQCPLQQRLDTAAAGAWENGSIHQLLIFSTESITFLLCAPGLANRVQQCLGKFFCSLSIFVLMDPNGLYRCYELTVQSTQVENIFSSRQAWSALVKYNSCLPTCAATLEHILGAKSEDAN